MLDKEMPRTENWLVYKILPRIQLLQPVELRSGMQGI